MVRFHGRPRDQSAARRAGQSPAQANKTTGRGIGISDNTNGTPQNEPTQDPTQAAAQQPTQSQAPVDAGAHGDPAPLIAKSWNRILYGYDDDGGHMHGYGWIHGKPEFPDDWDERKILDACIETMKAKAPAIAARPGGREDVDLVVDGKPIRVAITWSTNKKQGEAHHVVLPSRRQEVTRHVHHKGDGRDGAPADTGLV